MKSIALALVLALAAPALAQAQILSGGRAAVCYSYLSQTPASVFRLLKPALVEFMDEGQMERTRRPRFLRCVQGLIRAAMPEVQRTCAAGGDPASLIESALASGVFVCADESYQPPLTLFTEIEAEAEAEAPQAPRRGLGR